MPNNGSIFVTATKHQQLQDDREELARKLAELKGELKDLNYQEKDPTGNQPLQEAQREIARIDGRIYELDNMLCNAKIYEDSVGSYAKVTIGKRVVLEIHDHNRGCDDCTEPECLEVIIDGVCGSADTGERVITPESPIGSAIIGAKVGDECLFTSPHGVLNQIVIVSISSYS